ncbi:MAG: carbohydrate ABC transporter permease [Treponema sp.]|nr:carbohydrate ABC transporter permease [Treponema sp.]
MNKKENKSRSIFINLFTLYIPLLMAIAFVLIPFFWILVTSLKPEKDIMQRPIKYLPHPATFENFINAWNKVGFDRYFSNSFFIAVSVACVVLIFSTLVAYPLTRFHFRGKNLTMILLLCTQFLPQSMLLVPLFVIFKVLRLINSPMALVIVYVTFGLPFNTILMRGFMSSIPVALEEAAMIDGCSRLGAIYRVIVPLLLPAVVTCGSFAFIDSWKEFIFAVMFINDPRKMTIPVGLSYMIGEFTISYTILAAGAIIAILPPMFMFFYLQKYLIRGLSSGAVKG